MPHSKYKHPTTLWIVAAFNGFNAIGLGSLFALLVLYVREILHFQHALVYALFAAFGSLVYTLPLIGGFLAGHFGYKKCLIWGNIYYVIGLLFVMISKPLFLYLGLGIFVTGVALFVPSYLVLQGKAYTKDDHRRESGFTLSYVIMNIGFFISIVLSSYLSQNIGFHATFFIIAVIVCIPILSYPFLLKYIQSHPDRTVKPQSNLSTLNCWIVIFLSSIIMIGASVWLLQHAAFNNKLLIGLLGLVCVYLTWMAIRQKDPQVRGRLIAFILLSVVSIGFWALYIMEPALLTVFVQNLVNRHVFGSVLPPSLFFGLDPFFIVTLGVFFSMMWVYLAKRGRAPSLPMKFSISLVSMAIGFGLIAIAILLTGFGTRVNFTWIIFAYFFMSTAELLISPIGQAMVGRLSPEGHEGLFMGIWQMFSGVSASISGFMSYWAVIPKHTSLAKSGPIYVSAFGKIALVTASLAVLSFILMPFIKKALANKPPGTDYGQLAVDAH